MSSQGHDMLVAIKYVPWTMAPLGPTEGDPCVRYHEDWVTTTTIRFSPDLWKWKFRVWQRNRRSLVRTVLQSVSNARYGKPGTNGGPSRGGFPKARCDQFTGLLCWDPQPLRRGPCFPNAEHSVCRSGRSWQTSREAGGFFAAGERYDWRFSGPKPSNYDGTTWYYFCTRIYSK